MLRFAVKVRREKRALDAPWQEAMPPASFFDTLSLLSERKTGIVRLDVRIACSFFFLNFIKHSLNFVSTTVRICNIQSRKIRRNA